MLEGFCRVFMGVHYPTDVVGGFALGTAVALLLSPLASALLTPLTRGIGRASGWVSRLVWAPGAVASAVEFPESRDAAESAEERDLAA